MGKPSTGNAVLLHAEFIGVREVTGRTETSKYPEEQKSTETPQVVASERGLAQTQQVKADTRCLLGVVGLVSRLCLTWRQLQSWVLAEVEWNLAPQRAIVP
jgi:hypothetical protein